MYKWKIWVFISPRKMEKLSLSTLKDQNQFQKNLKAKRKRYSSAHIGRVFTILSEYRWHFSFSYEQRIVIGWINLLIQDVKRILIKYFRKRHYSLGLIYSRFANLRHSKRSIYRNDCIRDHKKNAPFECILSKFVVHPVSIESTTLWFLFGEPVSTQLV